MSTYNTGQIVSADVTTDDAEAMRDFYQKVVGWDSEDMEITDENGTYTDYVMKDSAGNWMGGVCHRRGVNKDLPPVWLVYINVDDIEASCKACEDNGGKVLHRSFGDAGNVLYAVIQDPAGAILAVTKEA